jgi:hypothetical protein
MYEKESTNFRKDCRTEDGAPEWVLPVPRLSTHSMMLKWIEIRDKPNAHYRILRKNCSTVVGRILREGMASLSTWQKAKVSYFAHNIYWTPDDVRVFAEFLSNMS